VGISGAAADGAEAIGMAGSEAAVGVAVVGAGVAGVAAGAVVVAADLAVEVECPAAEVRAAHGNDEKAIGANH